MPLPVLLAATYLVANLALMVWLVREESHGRVPPAWLRRLAALLRYGPAVLGLLYLITIAGDWPFVLFVTLFFLVSFWLLNGLLNYRTRPPKR